MVSAAVKAVNAQRKQRIERLLPHGGILPINFRELGRLTPSDEKWIVDWDNAMASFYLSEAGKDQ